MADPEWYWTDQIVLNSNRHTSSSELMFVNGEWPDSQCKLNEVRETDRTRQYNNWGAGGSEQTSI